MKINALEYYNSLPYTDFSIKRNIIACYFPHLTHCKRANFISALTTLELEPYELVNPLPLFFMADKMVWSGECKSQIRNQYYHHKCYFIKRCYKTSLCDEVMLLEPDFIRFRIGNYTLVQPRGMHRYIKSFDKTDTYHKNENPIRFPYSKTPFMLIKFLYANAMGMCNDDFVKLMQLGDGMKN